ncbi:hypothetical protein [Streptococcus mitis]|uniref:hypothetical protein n=1 Tax=Streptococcus mitis TaxID=28037 RepID=UPI002000BD4A|nr:hypothetical protein [Streptococcus mitis]
MNIGKIIKITEDTAYIGYEDGSLKEIPIESCDFEPSIGDFVEVYGDIAIKVNSKKSDTAKNVILNKLSMVSKINIFVIATMAIIMIGISIYSNENILEVMVLTTLIVSLIIIVLNLTFIIISSIKKNEVNKKSSIKTFIIAILTFILSIGLSGNMYENKSTVSKKTTSQNSSSSSSSSKASSSTTPSSSKESSSSSSSSVPSKPKITVDNDKANYGEVDYNSWNHDEIAVDTKVRVYGKVLQAMEDGKAYTLRVAINDDYDKVILVSIPSEYNNRVIAEDDHITLYGLAKGRQSYETVFKATKTLPLMIAYMYEN